MRYGFDQPQWKTTFVQLDGWVKAIAATSPPAVFFPVDGAGVDRARAICATCPVVNDCLEYALSEHIDHGVWGGCSERERRRIAKRRRIALRVAD